MNIARITETLQSFVGRTIDPDLIAEVVAAMIAADAMPADARPVPLHPEYKIDSTGTVWRVAPSQRIRNVPCRSRVVWMGSPRKKSPAVNLNNETARTIRSIMRQVWPEVNYTPPPQPEERK